MCECVCVFVKGESWVWEQETKSDAKNAGVELKVKGQENKTDIYTQECCE